MAVGAFPDVRKTAGPSCLLCCVCLAVLDDSYGLKVIGTVERTGNGPVVRDTDRLPTTVVTGRLLGLGHIALSELPAAFQQRFATLRPDSQRKAAAKEKSSQLFYHNL